MVARWAIPAFLLCRQFRSADELYIRAAGERTEATVCQVIRKYSQGRRSAWVYTPVFLFTDTQGQFQTSYNIDILQQVAILYTP